MLELSTSLNTKRVFFFFFVISLVNFFFRKGVKACIILSPLLGLTWVFGLLAVMDAGLVFQYIFTILNSAQVCLSSGFVFLF